MLLYKLWNLKNLRIIWGNESNLELIFFPSKEKYQLSSKSFLGLLAIRHFDF